MRLASREVCDDETWANTCRNRSHCSVQERLHMLLEDRHMAPALCDVEGRSARRLCFTDKNHVRVFHDEPLESDEFASSSDDDDSFDSFDAWQ